MTEKSKCNPHRGPRLLSIPGGVEGPEVDWQPGRFLAILLVRTRGGYAPAADLIDYIDQTPCRLWAALEIFALMHIDLIDYIETLEITQGTGEGGPFPVLPWQKRFLQGAFADDVDESALTVARGNGKTTLCAAIAAACLDGPLVQRRAEVVVCASSFDQGKLAFDHVLAFLDVHADRSKWRVWDSSNVAQLKNRQNGVTLKCIGSDPRRAHGLAPVLVLADEPAQWPGNTGWKMKAALTTALGKIEGGRFIALGTRPEQETHWFSKMLAGGGGADYFQVHAARKDDPEFQRRTWRRANPSFDYFPALRKRLQRAASKAKIDPDELAAFRSLNLNQGTSDVQTSTLVTVDDWKRAERPAIDDQGDRYILGVDLGSTNSFSAAAAYWPENGSLEAFAVVPETPDLPQRGLADGVGSLYVKMSQRDELLQIGTYTSSVSGLLNEALHRWGRPSVIVGDRFKQGEMLEACKASDLPVTRIVFRGQGYKDGAEDVKIFQRALADGEVHPDPSLLLRAAMSEVRLVYDASANGKIAKMSQGQRRQRARDDAAVAAVLAVAEGIRRSRRRKSGRKLRIEVA